MTECSNFFSDNEYTILTEIMDNENITQRELSSKLGVSVSTVNVLVNKMITEGLIKMTQVSKRQVLYMLTPIGMLEKTNKTVKYLKVHYRVIYETKEKIKDILIELEKKHDIIYILNSDDEMSEIVKTAVEEYKVLKSVCNIQYINCNSKFIVEESSYPIVVFASDNEDCITQFKAYKNLEVLNLLELL